MDQIALGRVRYRDVQQDQSAASVRAPFVGGSSRGCAKECSAVHDGHGIELRVESGQQRGKVSGALARTVQRRRRHVRQREFLERARNSAREARRVGDRTEVTEGRVARRVEHRAGGHRFDAKRGGWHQSILCQQGCRKASRELRQAESVEAERCASQGGQCSDKIVRRTTTGTNDKNFRGGRSAEDELARGLETNGRG